MIHRIRLWEHADYGWSKAVEELVAKMNHNDELKIYFPEEMEIGNIDYNIFSDLNVTFITGGFADTMKGIPSNVNIVNISDYFMQHTVWMFQYGKEKFPVKYKRMFCCLNGRPSQERAQMMDMLEKYKLLEDNYWTWNFPYDGDYKCKYWVPVINKHKGPMIPDEPPVKSFTSAFNLGIETKPTIPFITEKTYRPMMWKQMPLMLGPVGMHKWLEKRGFKLSPIVNYEFDNVANQNDRVEMLASEIQRISNKYKPKDIFDIHKPCVDHNFDTLLQKVKDIDIDILLDYQWYVDQRKEILNRVEYLERYMRR